ncbi:MAG TPA: UPF0175 family protein [Candidatus Bathyarchaeia archaeon]
MAFKVTTVRLPEETVEALEDLSDKLRRERSEVMREAIQIGIGEMKLRLALELYREGRVSFGRTAELAGLSQRALFMELKQRGIPYRYSEESFMEEAQRLVG